MYPIQPFLFVATFFTFQDPETIIGCHIPQGFEVLRDPQRRPQVLGGKMNQKTSQQTSDPQQKETGLFFGAANIHGLTTQNSDKKNPSPFVLSWDVFSGKS